MTTATVLVKRGPGRPRKDATVTTTVTVTEPENAPVVKRRPGRPKGSKNKPKVTATTTATAPVVKRGPGRPRKNPEALATAPVVKRGPGRPRKNPEATITAITPVVKRGPGRPRKNPEALATAPVVKRRPGRPKGSKNKPKVTATTTATAPVVKRGPGRPRKNPEATTASSKARQVLVNPFKAGDSVLIPSGTAFTSTAPKAKGRQVVKRGHNVTVNDIIPAKVQPRKSEKGSNVLVRPPRIRAKGSGGYWKDITLTEKIVKLNGKNPTYDTLTFKLTADQTA